MPPISPSAAEAWSTAAGLAVAGMAMTVLMTRRVLGYLRRRQILDLPNERSSHTLPTPRGGGLATTPVVAALLLMLSWFLGVPQIGVLGVGALVLLAVSWIDDRRGLPPLPRFLCHGAMIGLTLALIPAHALAFGGFLPVWADRVLAGIAWLWFVNLYNFMDGIDGITGVETASLGVGIAIVASLLPGAIAFGLVPAGIAVAAIGATFLLWNWHPAKVFLGDAGSVPFGFVLGGLLLLLAAQGGLAAALILPAYYLTDATITLIRRAANGEKVWQAHRKHFYQRAVQGGRRHDQVALAILACNVALVFSAAVSATISLWGGGIGAVIATGTLIWMLQRWARGGRT